MVSEADDGWKNPKVLTIFVVIFLCGAVIGATATRSILHARIARAASPSLGLQELDQQLQLTPDQKKVVMQELDDYAKYYQNIEEEREDVADHGKRRILEVLRPDQKKRFLEIFRSPALPANR